MAVVAAAIHGCDASQNFGGMSPAEAFSDRGASALAEAVCKGNTKQAVRLFGQGVAVDAVGKKGTTPLFWAVACDSAPGVEVLLKSGADPNRVADGNFSATWLAAERGHVDVLSPLLRAGGDVNARNRRQKTALMAAAGAGHVDVAMLLVESGADLDALDDQDPQLGISAPMYAVTAGHFDLALKLLQAGYTHDLDRFGWWVAGRVAGGDMAVDKAKLLDVLRAKGVRIPSEEQLRLGRARVKEMESGAAAH